MCLPGWITVGIASIFRMEKKHVQVILDKINVFNISTMSQCYIHILLTKIQGFVTDLACHLNLWLISLVVILVYATGLTRCTNLVSTCVYTVILPLFAFFALPVFPSFSWMPCNFCSNSSFFSFWASSRDFPEAFLAENY